MFRREADIEGGRTIYGREYISALQNRNKTDLLEVLGSAPLIVEELIPEDDETRYIRGQITKTLRKGGDWLGRMSGLSRIPGGLQQIAQQSQNRFMSRIEFELQSFFLPLQGFTREILYAYESYTIQYQTGSAIGGMIGGFAGAAIGFYYLGPIGAQIFGWLGQVGGTIIGGGVEAAIEGDIPLAGGSGYGGGPPMGSEEEEDPLDPTGGLPFMLFTGRAPDPESPLMLLRGDQARTGRRTRISRVDRNSPRRLT